MFFDEKKGASLMQVAHHEAGHAWMTIRLGRRVEQLLIQRVRPPATGFHGVVHSVGWTRSDEGPPDAEHEAIVAGLSPEQLRRSLLNDALVLLAGSIAEAAYVAKAKQKKAKITPQEVLQPWAGAMSDLIKADDCARVIHGGVVKAREAFLLNAFVMTTRLLEGAWKDVQKIANHAFDAIAEPDGGRLIRGTELHELFGAPSPTDDELDGALISINPLDSP